MFSATVMLLATILCGCRSKDSEPDMARELRSRQLAVIPVQPGEVVMADRQAPVRLVNSPCTVPVLQGAGRYPDVGWVGPEFFAVRSEEYPDGYKLTALASGQMRFTAVLRSPRSEDEARGLFRGDPRVHERILFCDVPATLAALHELDQDPERPPGPGIRRLAVWPTNGISAFMQLRGRRELTVDLSKWQATQEVVVSAVLDQEDASFLQRNLQSNLGQPIQFDVSSFWRRTGCLQSIRLFGISISGLGDGETGAVPLAEIKTAVKKTVAQSTKVDVDGECGAYAVTAPVTQLDAGRSLICRRGGDNLICRYEGDFRDTPAVYTTYATIFSRRFGNSWVVSP
jgi:hypothetical protein